MIGKFDYIHSLDRLSLAEELDKRSNGEKVRCFVQVNVSGEESKAGIAPKDTLRFIQSLESYKSLEIVGLMTMAPFEADPERTRPVFRGLRELRDEIRSYQMPAAPCEELSMGMSNDYHIALQEGATFIRIGSALIGNDGDN